MGAAVPASAPGGAARRLRVVARVHAMPPRHNAGAEWMLVPMLRALVERGHDVSVWLSRYTEDRAEFEVQGVRVVPLAARLDFAAAVRKADVLLSHLEGVPSVSALARGYGKPMVIICHNTHGRTFHDIAAGQTALAVYNSQWMAAEAAVYFAEHTAATRPAGTLTVRPPVFAAKYRTAGKGDCVTLVNMSPGKGANLFWKLAEMLPDLKFLGVQGSYGEQIVRELPNVEILDQVPGDRMAELVYARTRILLMPSDYESWGRAGVEAMASGIPVIAHPTPGLCESLGEAGIFLDRGDPQAWVDALAKLSDGRTWKAASKRALARSAELDPTDDLAAWCDAIESLGR